MDAGIAGAPAFASFTEGSFTETPIPGGFHLLAGQYLEFYFDRVMAEGKKMDRPPCRERRTFWPWALFLPGRRTV